MSRGTVSTTSGMMLDGKVAIITGAGSGIGATTARLFASHGARVVVADIDVQAAERVARSIESDGGTSLAYGVDVSDGPQTANLFHAAVERFGRLDIAVNNAALPPDSAPIRDLDEAYWDRLQNVDLKGTALSIKYAARQFLEQQSAGAIVNIASAVVQKTPLDSAAYVAAKHGVVGLTRASALELGPQNIRINCVCPGVVRTAMLDETLAAKGIPIETLAASRTVLGRIGMPDEIAQATMWLASDAASYVHGSVLVVDGGMQLL